jgi:hypothetical protein
LVFEGGGFDGGEDRPTQKEKRVKEKTPNKLLMEKVSRVYSEVRRTVPPYFTSPALP